MGGTGRRERKEGGQGGKGGREEKGREGKGKGLGRPKSTFWLRHCVIVCEKCPKTHQRASAGPKISFRLAVARHEVEGRECQRSTCSSVATTPLALEFQRLLRYALALWKESCSVHRCIRKVVYRIGFHEERMLSRCHDVTMS
jgi:hypothetical protein